MHYYQVKRDEHIDDFTKNNKQICKRCKQIKAIEDFYYSSKIPPNERHQISKRPILIVLDECKDCLKEKSAENGHLNDINTFLPYLKEMDMAYFLERWDKLKEKYPNRYIFGKFVAFMKLRSFCDYSFEDSDQINYRYFEEKDKEVIE